MPIKLVIFDLDGTLADSLPDLADATNYMLAKADRAALDPEQVRKLIGQGARRLVERALEGAGAEEVEEGLKVFLAYNDRHIADKTRLYPGVPETLQRFSDSGCNLAVVSNKNEGLCRKLLHLFQIDQYFTAVLGADSFPFRKPSPEPLLKLLRDFSVTAGEAVMIGDSINDIAAGKGAAVATIGCAFGYGDPDELRDADYLVDEFGRLPDLPLFQDQG